MDLYFLCDGLTRVNSLATGFQSIPIQGAIGQEVIDLLSILNSLRMILLVGQLRDFHLPGSAGKAT
jgi:hypothetical protein